MSSMVNERDWLMQVSIGTRVPASLWDWKSPSPLAGPKSHSIPNHCTAPLCSVSQLREPLWGQGRKKGRGLLSRAAWGPISQRSGPGASVLLTPQPWHCHQFPPFTFSPFPGALSRLPREGSPALLISCLLLHQRLPEPCGWSDSP